MPIDFSDLIPKGASAASPPAQSGAGITFDDLPNKPGISFDDLIPKKGAVTFDDIPDKGSSQGGLDAGDIAKSAGVGVLKGTIGLVGMAAELGDVGAQGIDAATRFIQRRLGLPESAPYDSDQPTLLGKLPDSAAIRSGVEQVTGPLYEPKTIQGRYMQTVGEFAPAAIGGPESLAARLMGRVVVPGVASEAAGQATEGTRFETAARLGGALAGGGIAAGAGALARGPAARVVPTAEELGDAVKAGYNDPAIKDLQFTPQAGNDLADQIQQQLKASKIDQFNAPGALAAVDRLRTPRFGPALTVDDLEAARQDARTNPAQATPAEQRAGPIVKSAIDDYLSNVPQEHLLTGDAGAANEALRDARGNAAAEFRANDISAALGRAENQAGSTYSGHNLDNATRQQLRPILNQKSGVSKSPAFQDYTDDEIAALRGAVNGSPLRNAIRGASKGIGGYSGYGLGIGAHEIGAGPLVSAGIGAGAMGISKALSFLANKMTAAEAERMAALLRQRSPLADQMLANAPPATPIPNTARNLMRGAVQSYAAQGQ